MTSANFPSRGIKSSFYSPERGQSAGRHREHLWPSLKAAFHSQALQAMSKMHGAECRVYCLKNNSKDAKDDKCNCLKARKQHS